RRLGLGPHSSAIGGQLGFIRLRKDSRLSSPSNAGHGDRAGFPAKSLDRSIYQEDRPPGRESERYRKEPCNDSGGHEVVAVAGQHYPEGENGIKKQQNVGE